jgi:hypothetical protein
MLPSFEKSPSVATAAAVWLKVRSVGAASLKRQDATGVHIGAAVCPNAGLRATVHSTVS